MLETIKAAFQEYQNKMDDLATASIKEAAELTKLSIHCHTVAFECQNVADLITKDTDGAGDLKTGLFGDVPDNSLALQ